MIDESDIELISAELEQDIYRVIAQEIGMENFIKLSDIIGGATIYIPKTKTIMRPIRDKMICKEFGGCSFFELSRKYDVSEGWVRQLYKKKKKSGGQYK